MHTLIYTTAQPHRIALLGRRGQGAPAATKASRASGWPKRCELAHAFLWGYNDKRLELAQLLGQLGVFLTQNSQVTQVTARRRPPPRSNPNTIPLVCHPTAVGLVYLPGNEDVNIYLPSKELPQHIYYSTTTPPHNMLSNALATAYTPRQNLRVLHRSRRIHLPQGSHRSDALGQPRRRRCRWSRRAEPSC
jgi:hypothetical protein